MNNKKLLFIVAILFSASLFHYGDVNAQKKKLTYKQVFNFAEPRLTGQVPRIDSWLDKDNYLEAKADPTVPGSKIVLWKVNAKTGKSEVYVDYPSLNAQLPEGYSVERADLKMPDYSAFIFNKKNNLYYYSVTAKEFKQLTKDEASEVNPKFSPNGKFVAYTKDLNLYVYDIEKEAETKLTEDGGGLIYNGYASWIYYEEILGRASRYAAFWWSPKSDKISFMRFDDTPVPEFILYRADGQDGEYEKTRYPKAGENNPFVKIGIADIANKEIVWADFDEKADHYVSFPLWKNDNTLTVQWMNRGQDNIIIYNVDCSTGKKSELYNEKQNSWVEWFEDLYFFENNSGFILKSNVDGWSHLYYYGYDGKLKSQLTKGNWNVSDVAYVDEGNGKVYFHGSTGKQWDKHLYVVDLNGKNQKQLTTSEGMHTFTIAPEGNYFIDRYSNIANPYKLDLLDKNGKLVKNLGDAKTKAMDEYDLGKAELFTIKTDGGFELPVSWVLPSNFDKTKKYPVIFSIYGGPQAPSVRNAFPFWFEGAYLASKDIIYVNADNRGSGFNGKIGASQMHRNLGKYEMQDLFTVIDWMKKQGFVDTTKIGITGGSYGGYVACMGITFGADYFTHSLADFSVVDWHLYDSHYTERYMDTPEENPEGYKVSSVMKYVDRFKGKFLITHGTLDDNVHMQNTIQLVTELQKQDKDFEMMLYPNQRHGYGMPQRAHHVRETVEFWFDNFLGKKFDPTVD
jgi:dipeptidyl-peptidase-4